MKRLYLIIALVLIAGLNAPAQHQRFKKTKTGLRYCYETRNRKAPQPKVGDVLVGEMTLTFDTFRIFSNEGKPTRIFRVAESAFPGDINEGLLMMHKGDKMSFIIPADSVALRVGERQMPPGFQPGGGQTISYTITLHDILTPEEVARAEDSIRIRKETLKNEENEKLIQYIKGHYSSNIEMTLSGVYIVVKQKGDGEIVTPGRTVKADYTGRLIEGKVFDSSIDSVAREAGIFVPQRTYGPISYIAGDKSTPIIRGWEDGLYGQPAGTELTLIIPSKLAYGEYGAGDAIPPYTTVIFDIKILSVE